MIQIRHRLQNFAGGSLKTSFPVHVNAPHMSKKCYHTSGGSHEPPPGLRGKQIGLWFAAHSKKTKARRDSKDAAVMDLTGINVTEVTQVLEKIQQSGFEEFLPTSAQHSDVPNTDNYPFSPLTRQENLDQILLNRLSERKTSPAYTRMLQFRKNLPAYMMQNDIVSAVKNNSVLVISGETGCGKTTQIPQHILESEIEAGNGSVTRILVTQPRRISAISVSERVALERGEGIGMSVGYQVRLEKRLPQQLQGSIMYVTTGVVLQWLQSDPMLNNFSHVIIDEVHERDFLCDFLLNILRNLVRLRSTLRIVLMSATMNADELCSYFDECPKLELPGRTFPVESYFLEDVLKMTSFWLPSSALNALTANQQTYTTRRYIETGLSRREVREVSRQSDHRLNKWINSQELPEPAARIVRAVNMDAYPQTDLIVHLVDHIITTTDSGAILVFVSGASAIRSTITGLREHNPSLYGERSNRVRIYPLHSQVSLVRQRNLFDIAPPGQRKVIVATNIAETSITIPDVVFVIDSGRVKMMDYDVSSNTNALSSVLISRANAAQRRGRAGRVQKGICYHLFTRFVYDNIMTEYPVPEMLRIRLEDVILRVKLLGLGPVTEFLGSCLSPPDPVAIQRTLHFLREIQALDLDKDPKPTLWGQGTNAVVKSRRQLREAARLAKQTYNSTGDLPDEDQSTETADAELPGDLAGLSALGVHLAQLPTDPQLAKLLIFGALFGCLEPALAVAACLNYRDPFEIPFDKQVSVLKMRRQLSQNTLSDHWVFVNVLREFRKLTDSAQRRRFCNTYLLRENILRDINSLMNDYATLLYERRYLESSDPLHPASNINKENFPLFRSILCGSLFPNILKIVPNERDVSRRPRIVARPAEGKISIGEFSVNQNVRPSDQVWAVYFQKTKMDASAPFVLDTTIVPLRPILLFAGILQRDTQNSSAFTVDGWIKVRADPKFLKILQSLRTSFESLLELKYRKPSVTDWNLSTNEGALLRTIVEFLVSETIPFEQNAEDSHTSDPLRTVD